MVAVVFVGTSLADLRLAKVDQAPQLLRAIEDALAGQRRHPSLSVVPAAAPNGRDDDIEDIQSTPAKEP